MLLGGRGIKPVNTLGTKGNLKVFVKYWTENTLEHRPDDPFHNR